MGRALLIIDVQEGYIEKYPPCLLARINERIQTAIIDNELVIYVKNTKKLRSGKHTNSFAGSLQICSDNILCKEAASAFSNNDLHGILMQNQVKEVEIVGIDGNSCISSTAIDALQHGYKVILPCRYIGVQNAERFEKAKGMLSEKGMIVR